MATIPAWITNSAAALRGRLPQLRRLWQVPVFLLGVVLLVSVCLPRPTWGNREVRQHYRNLAQARELAANARSDAEQLRALAQQLLDESDRFPEQAGEAHFLLGAAQLRQADRAGTSAGDLYQQARFHLEQAEALGVQEGEQARLFYWLGKACHRTRGEPQRIVNYLTASIGQGADDLAEGYAMLTQAYLALPTPDLKAALECNTRLLNLPTVSADVLAPTRLLRGELLINLGDPAGARKALESVKAPAPTDVLARARWLLARSYQAEERWAEAAALWKELAERTDSRRERSRVLCYLGACQHRLNQDDEALRTFERALDQAGDEEEQAAALSLAELDMTRDPQKALDAFERVIRRVQSPADWKNTFVELSRARECFEWACLLCRQLGKYEMALRLATLYERLAAPGRAQFLAAQVLEEWGKARWEAARQDLRPGGSPGEEQAARDLYCHAGVKYEASADPRCTPEERAERLWQSVCCFYQGRDAASCQRVLKELAGAGALQEKLGEGWYRLGEVHRALKESKPQDDEREEQAALEAFSECLKYPGRFAYRARYQLARDKINKGDLDGAQADLLQNLSLLASEMDHEAHESTVFELASILFHRRDYRQAASRLDNALDTYKDSPRALNARYQLAECYRHLAEQAFQYLSGAGGERLKSESKQFYTEQYERSLADAARTYQDLADLLSRRLNTGRPTEEEQALYRTATFFTAECRYNQGFYKEALELYDSLTRLYHNRVEVLHALAGQRQCHWAMSNAAAAREMLNYIQRALNELDDAAFDPRVSRWSRTDWQRWLENERDKDRRALELPASPGSRPVPPMIDLPARSGLGGR
jgi:TolA-binding protein